MENRDEFERSRSRERLKTRWGSGGAVSPPAGSGAATQKILKIRRFFSHEIAIFDFFQ